MRVRHAINYRSQTLFQLGLMFPDFPGHMPSFNSVDLPLSHVRHFKQQATE
jgi:hypothetical protein